MKCMVLKALWIISVLGSTAFQSLQFSNPQCNVCVQCMICQIFACLSFPSFCEFVPESPSSHSVIFCSEKTSTESIFFYSDLASEVVHSIQHNHVTCYLYITVGMM